MRLLTSPLCSLIGAGTGTLDPTQTTAMEKIYAVPVRRVCTDYAFVYASNAKEAQDIAQRLADNGRLECEGTLYGWDEQEAEEAVEDADGSKWTADRNKEALEELD